MSEKVLTTARHIEVNCEPNSEENIKIGRPEIVGYDFYISQFENFDSLKSFIEQEIKLNSQPLISVSDKGTVEIEESRIFNKKKIKACIKQGYNGNS